MARRSKSIRDIYRQLERIEALAGGVNLNAQLKRATNNPRMQNRYDIAASAAKKYANNIQNTKAWRDAFEKGAAWERAGRIVRNEASERTAGYALADVTKVSSRTYMGLAMG